jgi:hypothetical protein
VNASTLSRRLSTTLVPVVATALGCALLVSAPQAATAVTCKATPTLLSKASATTRLTGGLSVRVWDTGATPSNPQAATRIAVVKVPAASALNPRVRGSSTLTSSHIPSTYLKYAPTAAVMVNGGVFNLSRGALPDLPQMTGGRVTKARNVHDPVIAVGRAGESSPSRLWITGSATATGHGSMAISGLNWQSLTGGVDVYTTSWGSQSRPYGAVDVVVASGKVAALRYGSYRGRPPASGQTILTGYGAAGTWLTQLRVGTPVSASYTAQSDARFTPWEAVGRGARFLNAGVKNGGTCGTRDEELRPRTAIGWTKTGDLLFVTVSGRATINGVRYGGATIHQMADYMQQLGSYDATNLDGGGSTTMLARLSSGTVVRLDRSLSEAQRAVPNVFSAG